MRAIVREFLVVLVLSLALVTMTLGMITVPSAAVVEGASDCSIERDTPWSRQTACLLNAVRTGTFPQSANMRRSIKDATLDGARTSFTLIVTTIGVLMAIGFPLGIQCAINRQATVVRAARRVVDVVSSLPVLVWCTVVYLVGARVFHLSPSAERQSIAIPMAMLALVLGDRLLSDLVQRVEIATKEILDEPYMRMVRAGGFQARRHLLQGLVSPVAASLLSRAMFLISGAIVAEIIFDVNGLGNLVKGSLVAESQDLYLALAASMALVLIGLVLRSSYRVAVVLADGRRR